MWREDGQDAVRVINNMRLRHLLMAGPMGKMKTPLMVKTRQTTQGNLPRGKRPHLPLRSFLPHPDALQGGLEPPRQRGERPHEGASGTPAPRPRLGGDGSPSQSGECLVQRL